MKERRKSLGRKDNFIAEEKKGGKAEGRQGNDLYIDAAQADKWYRVCSLRVKSLTAPPTPVQLHRGAFHWGQVSGQQASHFPALPAPLQAALLSDLRHRFLTCPPVSSASTAAAACYDGDNSLTSARPEHHTRVSHNELANNQCAYEMLIFTAQIVLFVFLFLC